jgi:copper homeostasis protein
MTPRIELVAASVEAVDLAAKYALDRIELCVDLDQGGLTPSAGLVEYSLELGLETHILIRPRAAGFHYTDNEVKVMEKDIRFMNRLGVHGVVIGALKDNFELDKTTLERLISAAEGLDVTCHRAFDESFDWQKSMETLIQLGFKRILSAGLASNVNAGIDMLKQMKHFAKNRIEIMPGGGVNNANIQKILEVVQPSSIHFSGAVKTLLDEKSAFSETILKIEEKRVQRMVEVVRSCHID